MQGCTLITTRIMAQDSILAGSFVFSPSLMIEISGMYGMGFRNPSFTDLYYDGPRNIGNPSPRA